MKVKKTLIYILVVIVIFVLTFLIVKHVIEKKDDGQNEEFINNTKYENTVNQIETEEEISNLKINNEEKLKNKDIKIVNTVSDMKKIDFKLGEIVETRGYYEVNDNGAGIYEIVDKNEDNVGEDLDNGLDAEIIVKDKLNVHQLGAKGDGITDDTKAIQKAFNYGDGYIEFSEGKTYKVTELELREGNKILGNGASLKRANLKSSEYQYTDEQIYWNRLIIFSYYEENGGNSKDTSIDNLTFDGSAFDMWSKEDEYKYQQASLLLVLANSEKQKEIHANINVTNCKFINNYSDGIHMAQNVNAKIENCVSQDCFRGGLVITGGASNIECNNIKCISNTVNDGVDVEIDSEGYDGTKKSNINISNMKIDDDFDVAVVDGSKFYGDSIEMTKDTGSFNLENFESKIEIKNSKFYSDGTSCYFEKGNTQLKNVKFYAASDIQENTQLLELIDLGKGNIENYFEIKNCKFYGLEDRKYLISGIGGAINNGKIEVIGCYFDQNINQYAIGGEVAPTHFQVREILVKDCVFDNIGYSCCIVKNKYIESSKWIFSNMKVTNEQNKGIFREWGKDAIVEYVN